MSRLPLPFGTAIDRDRPIPFVFEGEPLEGLAGDTIASALAANGRWVVSRSFKYHRPRAIQAHGLDEAAALVGLPGEPNADAGRRLLSAGLAVTAQNVAGSLRHDRAALLGRFGRFLPVGFYYRTFFRPGPRAWLRFWEPLVRRAAGLGVVDLASRGPGGEQRHCHVDVAVIGGGKAGMSAALDAARNGAEVLLVEEDGGLGGALLDSAESPEMAGRRAAIAAEPRISVLLGARCTGWFAGNELAVLAADGLFRVHAGAVVLATGTYERPLLFPGNDLPGILFASAAARLMWRHGVAPGRRAVVVTAEDRGYRAAADLVRAGVEVVAVLDLRPGDRRGDAAWSGRRVAGARLLRARGTAGNWHLSEIAFSRPGSDRVERIACDLLCIAAGRIPAYHLPLQTGARLVNASDGPRIEGLPDGVRLAGSVGGEAGGGHLLDGGRPDGAAFVDLDEDVQVKDIRHALLDGYRDVELVKRFTTTGMGTSQGRLSGLAAASLVAAELGLPEESVTLTTVRPPAGPEELGRLAGPMFAPIARTPMHAEHIAAGGAMRGVGGWLRPAFYRAPGDAIAAEVSAVRNRAGLFDVSSLGKIELRGAEAGAFLDRLYTMSHAGQPVGRVRYGLMLNEMGSVMDDGVVARLASQHYYVTATSSGIEHVMRWLLQWRARWGMAVDIRNMTSALGAMNLAGPQARAVLSRVPGSIDFGADAFPYLAIREGEVAGVPVKAMRIGFAGELAFELHAPRSLAAHLWRAILAAGAADGLHPYGVEASRILRLEKGHIIVGQDTDAMTTPAELGFDWAVSKRKPFFLGKRALEMTGRAIPERRLVGFIATGEAGGAVCESLSVLDGGEPAGWVTSACLSPTLGRRIGLAIVPAGLAEADGLTIRIPDGRTLRVARAALPFYDPDNARQTL